MNYHSGEIKAHNRADVALQAMQVQRMLSPEISLGAKYFIEQATTLLITYTHPLGHLDMIWMQAAQGVARVPELSRIEVPLDIAYLGPDPQVWEVLGAGKEVGMMFMELENRRRYRVNGWAEVQADRLVVYVEQAFGNCPKYIQQRILSSTNQGNTGIDKVQKGFDLPEDYLEFIEKADTFFVGSRNKVGKADTSHRGGNPGFVEVLSPDTLRIPDYAGNNMFSTLGNFEEDSRGVLLFPDFHNGSELLLYGKVEIDWENQSPDGPIQRYWTFTIDSWKAIQREHRLDAHLLAYSPFNP